MDKDTQMALQMAASLNFTVAAFDLENAPRSTSITKITKIAKQIKNMVSVEKCM